ncbi:MAG: aminoacyl-tRNA hydrolase [Steroidobacteraceae bacterium]
MAVPHFKLLAGLGNPGEEYRDTPHNAGFWFIDALAARCQVQLRREPQYQARCVRARIGDFDCWLLQPLTYMNRSGQALRAFCDYYRITLAETLVIHDEIDLPPGALRLKFGGGHGGNNGLRDIIATCGADFWRLRIGVGHPGHKDLVADYLLTRARSEQRVAIDDAVARAVALVPELLQDGADKVMNSLHRRESD